MRNSSKLIKFPPPQKRKIRWWPFDLKISFNYLLKKNSQKVPPSSSIYALILFRQQLITVSMNLLLTLSVDESDKKKTKKKVEIKFVIKGSKFYCHPPLSRCFLMMIKEVKGGEGRCKTNNAFQYVPTEFYAISKGLFICIINCWWVICRVLICSLLLSPKNLHRCVILCRLNKTSKWFFINIPVACFLFAAAFFERNVD